MDIIRYGAFADRTLDFGDGTADLHLIVGANEAGKSTMLSAIGDLLWGMGERPPYAFRFDYQELRLGGEIEHAGSTLDFMRRKARVNSLLSQTEQPLADSSLAPFLGGLDRDGFDRMFGLNHERLRTGGRNMLSGKEDVARVLFEAGTGLIGVSEVLADLEGKATAIFTGGARNKPLNVALKEREASLASIRTAAVAPSKWKAVANRLEQASADHTNARERARLLEDRRSVLERDQRARPILTKIGARLAEIDQLGALPTLPSHAAAVRAAAARTIAETDFAIAEKSRTMDADDTAIIALPERSALLDHDAEINRLADDLALYRRNIGALPAAKRIVEETDATRSRLLVDGGLSDTTPLPSDASRANARACLDTFGEAETVVADAEREIASAKRMVEIAEAALSSTNSPASLAQLRSALDGAPRDSAKVQADNAAQIETAKRRTARTFAQLAPWTGDADALNVAACPSPSILDDHRMAFEDILSRRNGYAEELAAAEKTLSDARGELVRLAHLDREPPTPEKVAKAREIRDDTIVSLARVAGERATLLIDVPRLVRSADTLADRREAEANRVAEHARARAEIERATSLLETMPRRLQAIEDAQSAAARDWQPIWRAAGFGVSVSPQRLSDWVDARAQAIEATEFQIEREQVAVAYDAEIARHRSVMTAALTSYGTDIEVGGDLDRMIREATLAVEALEQERDDHLLATNRLTDAKRVLAGAAEELARNCGDRDRILATLPSVIAALGLTGLDAGGASRAVTAFETIAAKADGDRQARINLEEVRRAVALYENDLASLRAGVSVSDDEEPDSFLSRLRTELGAARQAEADRIRINASRHKLGEEIGELTIARAAARQQIDALIASANVTDLDGLDMVIENRATEHRLLREIADLRDDLVDAAGGIAEEVLRSEIAASNADEAASELADVKQAHQAIIDEISGLAAELAAAHTDERAASTGADAADAVQAAEVSRATIVDLSGHYIRAKSAATMLRWAINRHRETRQAPLLARAGAIMANVTDNRFTRLALDWSRGDEPVIVAERPDGQNCSVDSMSEGTRDQLFLSLRLAAIEERAADHPMPLICDDLFITADDARSGRLFRQMHELSASTQVIVFTHHEHLEEVATAAIGARGYHVHHVRPV